jgi:hypothetical protein
MASCPGAAAKVADVESHSPRPVSLEKQPPVTFKIDGSSDTLAYIDRHHAGVLNVHDVKVGIHELRMMKKFAVFLALLACVLLVGTCFVTYLAVSLAKEMHVHDQNLVDNDGHIVATVEVHETIHGVKFAGGRRMSSFTVATSNDTSTVVMSNEAYHSTRNEYISGQTDWVVDLPDGTVRTVHIQGMGSDHAWGICGACDGALTWQALCSWENGTDCLLDWQQSARSAASRRADTFLARAGQIPAFEDSSQEGSAAPVDRALLGKCNI